MRLFARLAWLVLTVFVAALPGGEMSAPVLPGGITDPAGRTGFLAGPSGAIDAVDLVTGDVLWTTDARRPLFAYGERLYALTADGHRPKVRAYDVTNRGERVFESEPLTLPEWASVLDGAGRSFTVRCRVEKGELSVSWEARQPREGRHAAGTALIDLRSREVTTAAPSVVLGPPAHDFGSELEKLTVRWQGVVGKDFKALVLEQEPERQKFVLHSWDVTTGKPNPSRELLVGRRLAVLPTVDDRFLFLRDASGSPDLKPDREAAKRFGWSIVSVATGDVAAHAPFEPGTQAVGLIGPRVFLLLSGPVRGPIHRTFVHPRSLKAIELKTGKTLWERPVEGKSITPPM